MKTILVVILLAVANCYAIAQTKPATTKPAVGKPATTKPAVSKPIPVGTKAPVVKAYWGTFTTGSYTIFQIKNMLDNALVLKDDKGVRYDIKKCSFLYKRKLVNKDEETGKTTTTWEYAQVILKDGKQLDSLWKTTIKDELQEGEELIFASIMADSKKGFLIPVSNISFTAKK